MLLNHGPHIDCCGSCTKSHEHVNFLQAEAKSQCLGFHANPETDIIIGSKRNSSMQRLLQCMNAVLQTEMIKKSLLFVGSPLFRWINHNVIEFEQKYSQIKRFLPNGSSGLPVVEECKPCTKQNPPGAVLTVDDIEMVVEKLGMGTFCEEIKTPCDVLEGVAHLLEQKEASLEELREAFAVFDQDGDGFISVIELQEVMCRLELAEGMKLEDCEKMIKSVDRNGDGKIDFYEFKDMLEHVT